MKTSALQAVREGKEKPLQLPIAEEGHYQGRYQTGKRKPPYDNAIRINTETGSRRTKLPVVAPGGGKTTPAWTMLAKRIRREARWQRQAGRK